MHFSEESTNRMTALHRDWRQRQRSTPYVKKRDSRPVSITGRGSAFIILVIGIDLVFNSIQTPLTSALSLWFPSYEWGSLLIVCGAGQLIAYLRHYYKWQAFIALAFMGLWGALDAAIWCKYGIRHPNVHALWVWIWMEFMLLRSATVAGSKRSTHESRVT